jgi:hypothetical protein
MARILRACSLTFLAAAAAIALASTQAALEAQAATDKDRIAKPFVSAGRVYMSLSAGGYRIQGTGDKEIRVRWQTRDPDDMARVRAKLDVNGRDATLHLDGPSNNFHVVIEVPERTDLVIRLSAGELDVRRIEGSKDIDMWAGDVTIEVGEAERYRRVQASVRAGEISSSPFRVNKGGLFRSFEFDGKGPYDLRVKLMAGDLKLVR